MSVVELHVAVNCVQILSAARHCVYGQFYVTGSSAVVHTSFWKKLYSILFVLSSHATYKGCIETKECSFADGLDLTYSLAKDVVLALQSLCSFSVLCCRKTFYVIRRN